MNEEIQQLLALKARVLRGEPGAAEEFRQALEPYLPLIVRRALRPGAQATSQTCWIHAEANRVQERDPDLAPDSAALAEEVAHRLSARAIDRLQSVSRC